MAGNNKNGDFLRKPPASVEAEQALLSAILSNTRVLERVSEYLLPEHFVEAAHRRIYDACAKLSEKGHLVDAITVKNYLKLNSEFDEAQAEYLASLAASTPSVVSAGDYGKLIYDLALKRELIDLGSGIAERAFGGGDAAPASAVEQIGEAEQRLYDLATKGDSDKGLEELGSIMKGSMSVIEAAFRNDGKLSGISTGITKLDNQLGGLHPTDLIVIAARPGMGKTALGLNIAFNAANEVANGRAPKELNGPVAFFSLEMSADQLATRVLSFSAEIPGDKLLNGRISREEFDRAAEMARALSTLKLYTDDTPGITVQSIRTRARRLKRVHGGLALVVVDYIQLINTPGAKNTDNRVQQVSEITRALKVLAKELEVPVIALSQLSRAVEQRGTKPDDKKPQLADLRESGSIEQDADIVMFIFRKAYYHTRDEPSDTNSDAWRNWKIEMDRIRNRALIMIAKQRHGPTGDAEIAFVGEYTKFDNLYEGNVSP
ncbi:MAG: replicative DNA helicase [Rickettsiales bacterium]|jgi:replicative DNA helicase|nr:replicative DNA helicase [Rickettsiales bacterium]